MSRRTTASTTVSLLLCALLRGWWSLALRYPIYDAYGRGQTRNWSRSGTLAWKYYVIGDDIIANEPEGPASAVPQLWRNLLGVPMMKLSVAFFQ